MNRKFGLFILMLSLIAASCGNKNTEKGTLSPDLVNNPVSADSKEMQANLPVITFDQTFHDFGRVISGEKVSYSFKFKNTGNTDLLISKVSSSCGCTVPKYPHTPVKPGEEGIVEVSFDSSGRKGFQNKSVTVMSNAQPNTKILRIKAEIIRPEN